MIGISTHRTGMEGGLNLLTGYPTPQAPPDFYLCG